MPGTKRKKVLKNVAGALRMTAARNPRLTALIVVALVAAVGTRLGVELSADARQWIGDFVTLLIGTAGTN